MGIQTSNRSPCNRSGFIIDRLMILMPDPMNLIVSPPKPINTHPYPAYASSSHPAATDGRAQRPKNWMPLPVVLDTGAILPTEKGLNADADSDAFHHTLQCSSLDEPTGLSRTTLDGP